jgi:DNA polymerase-4
MTPFLLKHFCMTQRKIIHVDCDCFYAAIEMRDDPRLAGKPWRWGLGGSAWSDRHLQL